MGELAVARRRRLTPSSRLCCEQVSELADLRAAALPGGAGSGCAPLCDAGGCSELAAVMSVLGCMF